jgi:hypothetical protein
LTHGLVLHIDTKEKVPDLELKADPSQGGLVLTNPAPLLPEGELSGVVRGKWGFADWEGPRYHLRVARPGKWTVAATDQSALVVGREDTLQIEGENSLCVDRVEQLKADGSLLKLVWKSPKPEMLEVAVPLKDAAPGPVTFEIRQFGITAPDRLNLIAYAEAASLDRLTLSAGDTAALLKGTRLDEVAQASLEGITWTPAALSRVQDFDRLTMNADKSTADLESGKHYMAKVKLLDGRLLKVPVSVDAPRPQVELLSKGVQDEASDSLSAVHLNSPDDLPIDRRLVFFLRSRVPAEFPRTEKVEVAATDGSFHTVLALSDSTLMLEDAKTAMGVVEPLARFGSSAFGPLRARAVSADGVTGDWFSLGTLVRLPGFKELRCPHAMSKSCTLTGTNLFLAASIGATPEFANATDVPPDFTGTQLSVPHPSSGMLYLKLRDDPANVQTLTLPATIGTPSTMQLTPASVQPVIAPAISPAPVDAPTAAPTATAQPVPASIGPAKTDPVRTEPVNTEPVTKAP